MVYDSSFFTNIDRFAVCAPKNKQQEYFENEQLAYEATKQGNIWGYVGFHENFTQAFVSRMSKILRKDSEMPDKETRNQSTAQVSKHFIFPNSMENQALYL